LRSAPPQPAGGDKAVFRQFVIKVHSRCNLACDYCYVYEHPDQSWRDRPVVMADDTMQRTAARIGLYCRVHELSMAHVVFHGGEPLLAGRHRIRRLARLVRAQLPAECELELSVQTNGTLIDVAWCELFRSEDIRVGISLDGDRGANDLHRMLASGKSSHAAVVDAVRLLNTPRYRSQFSGLLCTIDPRANPLAVYEGLCSLRPPKIDFLLPHATWEHPPDRSEGDTPYADWLLVIHRRWRHERDRVRVRLFESIERLAEGESSLTEALGLDEADLVVIETDGAIEQVDSLKAAYEGAPETGYSIHDHDLDQAAEHPGFVARSIGLEGLCATCRACPLVHICGGGLYPHRYRPEHGFDNPSVYCADLTVLIPGVLAPLGAEECQGERAAGPHPTHVLAGSDFDELAAGGGGADAMAALLDAQRSLRRELIAAWLRTRGPSAHRAWERMAELAAAHPAAVERVLDHPYVGIWAGDPTGPLAATYLEGMTLAASVVAGVPWRAELLSVGGLLSLPTVGALPVPATSRALAIETDPATNRISVNGEEVALTPDGTHWRPMPILCDDHGWTLRLDDADPLRDCYGHQAAPPLTHRAVTRWAQAFGPAVAIIRDMATHFPALQAGLSTITPLASTPFADNSATHRRAFGAIAIALPWQPERDVEVLALALIHELQHLKLGAVLDLFALLDPQDQTRYRVPWRADPRPLEAVLQGAYAHLAVADFWRTRATGSSSRWAGPAITSFETLHDQIGSAVATVARSDALTDLGRRWVENMRVSWVSRRDTGSLSEP
jgi:uncharacterized protein